MFCSLQGGAKDAAASTSGGAAAAVAASPEAAPVDPAAAAEKQVKALRKKLRQCEALAERKATGTTLSAEEEEKLSKAAAW